VKTVSLQLNARNNGDTVLTYGFKLPASATGSGTSLTFQQGVEKTVELSVDCSDCDSSAPPSSGGGSGSSGGISGGGGYVPYVPLQSGQASNGSEADVVNDSPAMISDVVPDSGVDQAIVGPNEAAVAPAQIVVAASGAENPSSTGKVALSVLIASLLVFIVVDMMLIKRVKA
jgi:hypothetical protein